MSYQPGIPTGSVPLNQDYLNVQGNFTFLNNAFSEDHSPLTGTLPPVGTAGYHESVHLVPVSTTSSNPPNNQPINGYTATPGYGQAFNAQINDGINTDEAFFFLSGGNRLTQLTRNFAPSVTTSVANNPYTSIQGATSLPGGLILNYGFVTSAVSGNNVVTLQQAFPNNFFGGWASNRGTGDHDVNCFTPPAAANFTTLQFYNNAGAGSQFFWFAIGN